MKQSVYELHGLLTKTKTIQVPGECQVFNYLDYVEEEPNIEPWQRPSDWLIWDSAGTDEPEIYGLYAIYPGLNHVAIRLNGAYTVDWGDGTVENFNTGVIGTHIYDHAVYDTGNETRTTEGFKQAVIRIRAQPGNSLTGVFFDEIYPGINNRYVTGWIDIDIDVPTLTNMTFGPQSGGASTWRVNNTRLRKIRINRHNVTNFKQMFKDCALLEDISEINFSPVVNMDYAFQFCSSIREVSNITFPNVLTSIYAFSYCPALRKSKNIRYEKNAILDYLFYESFGLTHVLNYSFPLVQKLENLFTTTAIRTVVELSIPSVTDITGLFQKANQLRYVSLKDTGMLKITHRAFAECGSLRMVDFIGTNNIENAAQMFMSCWTLPEIPLTINYSSIKNANSMFYECRALTRVPVLSFPELIEADEMFNHCTGLVSDISLDTPKIVSMSSMFRNCRGITTLPLLNYSSAKNINNIFSGCGIRECPDLVFPEVLNASSFINWNPLTKMGSFTAPKIVNSGWLFAYCPTLVEVGDINLPETLSLDGLFDGCTSLKTIGVINAPKVTSVQSMFYRCSSLKRAPFFNTSLVKNMNSMFQDCYSLEHVPEYASDSLMMIGNMFSQCRSLTRTPSLNISKATSEWDHWNIVTGCGSLVSFNITGFKFNFSVANCKLSATELDRIYSSLSTVTGRSITVTGNPGTTSDTISIATAKGWTVTG